jgi:competence protein ComEC
MTVSALLFLTGIVLVQQLPELPGGAWLTAGTALAGIMAWRRNWRCLFFMLGLLWAVVFATIRLSDRLPEALEGKEVQIRGYIADLPEKNDNGVRFDFVVTESEQPLPPKIRLSWYYPEQDVKAGQFWSFTVRLKRPHGNINPGGFDYERWLFSEGIGATGYVRSHPKPGLLALKPAWHYASVWRQSIADRLSDILEDSPNLGLIKALTIGDGSSIDQQQWELFRKTGTTHLVVISGSHIGLVSGLIYFVALKLWARTGLLRWSPQKIASVTALSVAVFYSALAGFSVPTQRSVIMLAVAMAALILQRNTRPFNILASALFAVLLYDPLAVLSAGFWLSFLAVGLIVFSVAERLGNTGYFLTAIKLHWVTSIGLAPLLLLFFQQVSIIAPLANLIAVPIISLLIVPLSLLAIIVMFAAPPAASFLFLPVDWMLQGLEWVLTAMADIPQATISHEQPSVWALFFAIPALLLALAPFGTPSRWLSLAMLLPLIFTGSKRPEPGEIRLTLLDVGQGLAAAVQTAGHWLIFDTGAKFSDDSDMGKNVLLPFLRTEGAEQIDRLVVSHGDNDHIGGALSLMRSMSTKQVMTSVPGQFSGSEPVKCAAGQSWQWDRVTFTMLSPGSERMAGDNDNSCVLKIESDRGAVLLTGDIEASAESWLVSAYGKELKANVLIAPHHGSKTSSTESFLEMVKPDFILIPAGYRNQFGHPHRVVLGRYRQINATVLNSADSGAIQVDIKKSNIQVQALRRTDRKYWRDN